jgi:protein-L-isoaspartate(D-aspartate) O-methyltransferase
LVFLIVDMDYKFAKARNRMVNRDLRGRDITDPSLLAIMAEVPREQFLPESYRSLAYNDGPLPIGNDQTISQPYIVALMTQELRINQDCVVLEIGTGSGYQTAVLSRLAKKVYTIERFAELSESARTVLNRLDVDNVEFCVGDGSCGWPASRLPPSGFFDRIMITAAVPNIPEPVAGQLVDGGLIIAPVGGTSVQELIVGEKRAGKIVERLICGLTGFEKRNTKIEDRNFFIDAGAVS